MSILSIILFDVDSDNIKEGVMKREFKPIAIIGYGCIFTPDGTSTQKFWENVLEGMCGISDVSKYNWKESLYYDTDKHVEDKTYCKQGGYFGELSVSF